MYSKVDTKFWTDEKVLSMSADARYLMLYLLTTKHRNMIGLYILPLSYAQEDTALSDKRFRAAWREILQSGMVLYDADARVVCVRNFLRYNPIDGPKQVTGAVARLDDLPKTAIARAVVDTLRAQTDKPYLIPLAQHVERVCIGIDHTAPDTPGPIKFNENNTLSDTLYPAIYGPITDRVSEGHIEYQPDRVSDTLSDTHSDTVSDTPPNTVCHIREQITDNSNQYTESSKQYTDNDVDNISIGHPAEEKEKPRRASKTLNAQQTERFNRFWALYPRKIAKAAAERAWKRINPDDDTTEKILDGLTNFVHFDPRTQGEDRFIPHPATWLNASEWTNEYKPRSIADMANRPAAARGDKPDTLGILSSIAKGGL